jgi:Predicted NTPase (NACHT family)
MKNAYILHSLGLPKHQSKIYGEIDFVIVCDRSVACLEVKGGRIECRDVQCEEASAAADIRTVQVMEALGMNDHLLVSGGTGTGKTLLAADFAIKRAG